MASLHAHRCLRFVDLTGPYQDSRLNEVVKKIYEEFLPKEKAPKGLTIQKVHLSVSVFGVVVREENPGVSVVFRV